VIRLRSVKLIRIFLMVLMLACAVVAQAQQTLGTLLVEVRSASAPASQVEISAGGVQTTTNDRGEASFQLPSGPVQLTLQRFGFVSKTIDVEVVAGTTTRIAVQLETESVLKEEITVTATRTEKRIEEEPLRVEVLDREEVEEKTLMTPGDIAMLLNETSGLRVQVTSPSLGAANVRVQGLRGRYTQLLADGLPLYGGQSGSIGLLQIPPLDLGQVEVIKGVASALYGSSALGGVINLVSRRPQQPEREVLFNRTSRGGTDTAFWLAEPVKNGFGYTLLGAANFQSPNDVNGDGWADLAGYHRGTIRPRFIWDNGKGRSIFLTTGAMAEDREGGTIGDARTPDGQRYPEKLSTRRLDTGLVGRFLLGTRLVSVRASAMTQQHRHQFGEVIEHDRHGTWFGEASIGGTDQRHTWTAGTAFQSDIYRARELSSFNYTYVVPAGFVQDDYSLNSQITLSGSARLDVHNKYGAFLNPRLSALVRMPHRLTARISTGTGVFAPTPFTEETEASGLSRLGPLQNLQAERAVSASGDLGWASAHLELNGTFFISRIRHALMLREVAGTTTETMEIFNSPQQIRTAGSELLARLRGGDFNLVVTHTFIHSTELDPREADRRDVPLTPKYTAGVVGTWEKEGRGRVGIEMFYTGEQRLDENPYRARSVPYWIFGLLIERRFGRARFFVNAENLGNVKQTRYDRLIRPTQHFDGRWTVDAWAPLDGRVINGGLRWNF
jgi:outer membrane receptor for ferrienterochelin and colicins